MPATKLTSELKQQILNLYCETDASTTELASQFGVSSSTVLRLLQGSMSTEDYQKSVKQKQSKNKRSPQPSNQKSSGQISSSQKSKKSKSDLFSGNLSVNLAENLAEDLDFEQDDQDQSADFSNSLKVSQKISKSVKKLKEPKIEKKERTTKEPELNQLDLMAPFLASSPSPRQDQVFFAFESNELTQDDQPSQVVPENLPILAPITVKDSAKVLPKKVIKPAIAAPREKFSEEEAIIDDVSYEVSKEYSDDEFESLDDEIEDELEEGEEGEEIEDFSELHNEGAEVKIYPLENADLPSTCYMVVDKSSEMITRPLKDFSEIGKIPPAEESSATLLIFSNHRVAKRFSRQSQRIIKFSGNLIYITHEKLAAKGITRLLFEGRVYAL